MAVSNRFPRHGLASAVRVLAVLPLFAVVACGGGGGGDPTPVVPTAISSVDGIARTGVVGAELSAPVRVRLTDASGKGARGATVTWTARNNGTVAPATSTANADGIAEARWTLGPQAGEQTLIASAGSLGNLQATVTAAAAADRAASVHLSGDTVLLILPGSTYSATARIVDRFGNPVAAGTGAGAIQWSTSDQAVASVDAAGVVTGRAAGRATLTATADGVRGQSAVVVMSPMTLSRATPDSLVPGATVTIDGTGFPTQPSTVSVAVSGASAVVTSVTATRITATVPSQTALPCEPLGAGRVVVRRHLAGAVDSSLVAARVDASVTRSLAVGESTTLENGGGVGCVRLDRGGRYLVSVFSAGNNLNTFNTIRLRGLAAPTATTADLSPATLAATRAAAPSYRLQPPTPRPLTAAQRAEQSAEATHGRLLEAQNAIVAQLGSPLPGLEARRRAAGVRAALVAAPPNVGDTVSLNALFSSCQRGTAIKARVVYVGAKNVVYEDVQSPSAGQMDSELRRVGEEFDTVQLPILEQYFASPLAMDARLDNDGKVAMLFTKFVNDSLPGVIGYVTACNFYAPTVPSAAASNQRELFYARTPRVGESAAEWRKQLRSTVIHEVKHLASYAERFLKSNGASPVFEEPWLEESTARLAEEFYARTFSGATWKGNAGYQQGLACEYVPCAGDDRPKMMLKHYEVLADYYSRIGSLTPLGSPTGSENTYYASGWLLVRWAIDQYASDEASFIRALVTETGATGIANIARRTGRPAAEMLADWSLAIFADDRAGTTPRRTQLSIPSWNTRDVFRGLNAAGPAFYPRQFPLQVQQVRSGAFSVDVSPLRSWSASFFELAGSATDAPQLLELKGGSGGQLSSQIGMAVLRVE